MEHENSANTMPNECQGYQIVFSYKVGEITHAIGHNPKAPSPYVAWYYTERSGFYWGSYTGTYEKAMTHLLERVRIGDVSSLKGRGVIPSDKGGRDVR